MNVVLKPPRTRRCSLCRYRAYASYTKEEACTAFMRVLRTLPYGNATFFAVRRIGECGIMWLAGRNPARVPCEPVVAGGDAVPRCTHPHAACMLMLCGLPH
jgi:hypothetical protein